MNTEAKETDDAGSKDAGRKLQLVHAGSTQFGIFADEISAIADWQEPAPLPHAPSTVLGVVSVQGRMLTVLDLAALTLSETALSDVRNAAGYLIAVRGDEQLALAVDAVGEIITCNDSMMDSPEVPETASALVRKVLQHEGGEIKILNLNRLFATAIQGRRRRQRQF
ncbi:MAG: chemotaxis protein CheW [bacterium]